MPPSAEQPPTAGDRSIDLLIRVTTPWGRGGNAVEYVIHSPSGVVDYHHEPVRGPSLHAPERFREQLFDQITRLQRGLDLDREPVLAAEVSREIESIGHDLYQQLFPREMRLIYREVRDQVRSLLITSDEPWIPWEILRPSEAEGDDFLALRFLMGRWLTGESSLVSEKTVHRVLGAHAGPSDGLKQTEAEIGILRQLVSSRPETDAAFQTATDFSELTELVESGIFDLIHFAGHGVHHPGQASEDALSLADRALRARHFSAEAEQRLRERRPLVFLNACQLGRVDRSLTDLDGWAARWVRRFRCSAFVAPYWPVRDARALGFARTFYSELQAGRTLGEAVLEARRTLRRENPADLAWLSYSFYGHPDARIDFGAHAPEQSREDSEERLERTTSRAAARNAESRGAAKPETRPEASPPHPIVNTGAASRTPRNPPALRRAVAGVAFLLLLGVLALAIYRPGAPDESSTSSRNREPHLEQSEEAERPPPDQPAAAETTEQPPDPSPVPLLPPEPGKVGIVVLASRGALDRETARALESVLATELEGFAPFVPSSLSGTVAERFWQEDAALFTADGRVPWGAEYLVLARSERRSLAAPSHLSSLSLSLQTKLLDTQPFGMEVQSSQTHTGMGSSSHTALVQAATRCTREILEHLQER